MLNNVFAKLQKPLLSQDSIQDVELLDGLSEMTELESLIAIKDQIKQIDFVNLRGLEKKVDLVLALDGSIYRKGKSVAYNYLIKLNDDNLKHDAYVVAYEYYKQLYTAYSHIFSALETQKKLKLKPGTINLVLARYLNATFMMLKWRYFDKQSAIVGVWDTVHKVIRTAEKLAVMNKHFFLYDFQVKETSIAAILERGFMLDTLQQGHYSQLEIELTDRVLKIWSANPIIANTYKANQYHFFISLEKDNSPERLGPRPPLTECCYWSTSRLVDLMESYLCAADMHKTVTEFGLDAVAPVSKVVKLFKKLRVDWSAERYSRHRRGEERNKKSALLKMHYGIEAIHEHLILLQDKQLQMSKGDDFTFELQAAMHGGELPVLDDIATAPDTESRWMVDESSSGFAVDFGRRVPNWVDAGMLVCYSESGYQTTFNIAEIRSVRKLASGAYRAGFKKISRNTTAVHLSRVEVTSISTAGGGYALDDGLMKRRSKDVFSGLLIDHDVMGKPKLLVPLAQFERDSTFNVLSGKESLEVKAGNIVSKHNNWVLFEALPSDS